MAGGVGLVVLAIQEEQIPPASSIVRPASHCSHLDTCLSRNLTDLSLFLLLLDHITISIHIHCIYCILYFSQMALSQSAPLIL